MSTYDHARSFGQNAADYARHRPTYPPALFAWLAEIAPARRLAVDVAAGAGQGALGLAAHFERVIATDQSPELLATIPEHQGVTTLVQPAEALDIGTERADLVATFQALHWFAGEPFWSRVRATLRPGGILAAVSYAWFSISPTVDVVIADRLLPALDPHWSPRNRLLFEGYRTVDVPFEELAPATFAIDLVWTRTQLEAYLGTWSAVTRLREVEGRDVIAEIAPALADAWPDDAPRDVTMPLWIRVFRA